MARNFFALAALLLCPLWANAQTIIWNNNAGGNFLTGTNWVGGVAPGSLNDAVIDQVGTYTITLASSTTIQSLLLNNATTTFNQSAGTFTITNPFTFMNGIYNLSGGVLTLNGGMSMAAGTMTVSGGATINLTGTMALNGGLVNLNNGTISGGSITGGGNRLRITNGTLNNVNVAAGTLDFATIANNALTLQNGVTFGAGSAYSVAEGSSLRLGVGQSSLSNLALTYPSHGSVSGLFDNATITLGSSGTANPTLKNTGLSTLSVGLGAFTTNRHIINDGVIENAGAGDTRLINQGTFTNNGTLLSTLGLLQIIPQLGFTNSATGVITIAANATTNFGGGGTFSNVGTVTLNANGTLNLNRNFVPADLGTITRTTPITGTINLNQTLTLPANYNLAGLGTVTLTASTSRVTSGVGGPFTLSTSNASRLRVQQGILDNVNVAAGTLDLATLGGPLTLQNGVTFGAGSAYSVAGDGSVVLGLGVGQSSLSNLALTYPVNGIVYGLVDNATITLGSSGTANPTLKNTGPALLDVGLTAGTNRHIINGGVIENAGTGTTILRNSGTFTNNGTVKASGGTITINPGGGLVIGAGSALQTSGGTIVIATTNVTNGGSVTATTGTVNIANTTAANYGITSTGSTAISSTAILNVGNTNTSTITNAGSFVLSSGGTVNLGPNANPGLFTNNTGGIFQANGTAFVRLTVAGGTLTGAGTINALASSSVVIGVGGKLAPGNSPGIITIGGGLDIGGTLELDIANGGGNNSNGSGTTTPGIGFDTITVSPPPSTPNTSTNVTIRTATTNFVLKTGNASQALFNADSFWNSLQKWAFLRTTNGAIEFRDTNNNLVNSPASAAVSLLDSIGGSITPDPLQYPNSSWMFEDVVASDIAYNRQFNLVWNPVPEPTTVLGITVIGLGIGAWVRRRRAVA